MAIEKGPDGNYTILTTYQCNWNCSYCIIDTHLKNATIPIDTSQLMEKIQNVEDDSYVCLTGGEIGLLHPEVVEEMFNTLMVKKCQIAIFTNGLFIRKYEKYLSYADEVHYHCVENLDQEIEFPCLDQEKFIYILVMTNSNIDNIDSFIEKYPSIKFKLKCNYKNGEELDRAKAFKVLMKNKSKIHPDSFKSVFEYYCNCKPE